MIRRLTRGNHPKPGEWILQKAILKHSVCLAPLRVVSVAGQSVVGADPRPGGGERRMKLSSVLFITPSQREAEKAFEANLRYSRKVDEMYAAAVAEIESINEEPVV